MEGRKEIYACLGVERNSLRGEGGSSARGERCEARAGSVAVGEAMCVVLTGEVGR